MANPTSSRTCPACGGVLRGRSLGATTVDGCDACGGVWFDPDELKAVAGAPGGRLHTLATEFTPLLGADPTGGRGVCPVDAQPLRAGRFKQADDVELLACPSCRGVWLGHRQLDALSRHLATEPAAPRAPAPAAEPAPEPEDEVVSYRYTLAAAVRQIAWLGFLLLLIQCPWNEYDDSSSLVMALSPDKPLLPVIIVVAIWMVRWPLKTYRVDLTRHGIVLHRLYGQKLVPWQSIRSQYILDLREVVRQRFMPGQGPSLPAYVRVQARPGGSAGFFERGRALIVLWTTVGLVTVGPDFDHHWELIYRIADHD